MRMKFVVAVAVACLMLSQVNAQQFHPAEEIIAGNFSGDYDDHYTFPGRIIWNYDDQTIAAYLDADADNTGDAYIIYRNPANEFRIFTRNAADTENWPRLGISSGVNTATVSIRNSRLNIHSPVAGGTALIVRNVGDTTDRAWITEAGSFVSKRSSAGAVVEGSVGGDSFARLSLETDRIQWGSGSVIPDTNLYRSAANILRTDDTFRADGGFQVDGTTVISGTAWVEGDRIKQNSVDSGEIQDNTLTAVDLSVNVVSSLDGVTNDGGNIDLVAGSGISITPDDVTNTITITNTGGSGPGGPDADWVTDGNWLWNNTATRVGIGTNTPDTLLDVESSGTPILTVQTSAASGQDAIVRIRGSRTTSASADVAQLEFYNNEAGDFQMAEISTRNADGTSGTSDSDLLFKVNDGSSPIEAMRIDHLGRIGIGTDNPNERLTIEGALSLDEISAPSTTSGYGKVYVKSDNKLYFKDDGGTEYDLTSGGVGGADADWATDGNWLWNNTATAVGIGTNTPHEKLEVAGNIRIDDGGDAYIENQAGYIGIRPNDATHGLIMRDFDGSSTAWSGIRTQDDGSMELRADGGDYNQLVLADNGNVGIGTSSPTTKLMVVEPTNNNAVISIHSGSTATKTSAVDFWDGSDGPTGTNKWGIGKDDGNEFYIAEFGVANRLKIEPGGEVGIGADNPDDKLEVAGVLRIDTNTAPGSGLQSDLRLGETSTYKWIQSFDAQPLAINPIGNNVGIGTTNPISKLSVGGDGEANTAIYAYSTTYGVYAVGHTWAGVYGEGDEFGVYGLADAPSGSGVYGKATGFNSRGVEGNGQAFDFYAVGPGVDYGSSSSIRWKRNIRPVDNSLERVLKLRGVYFDWDEEHGGEHDIGMIAEEVGNIIPEIVEWDKDAPGYTIGMDYSKLTPLLVEAIKEQQKQIDNLKLEIEQLEAQI